MAYKRLISLESRFQRNPELSEKYHNAMEEYIYNGYAEQIPKDEIQSDREDIYYLPHLAVIKENRETTKVRIVYHGSSKVEERESLNYNIRTGLYYRHF